MEGLRDFEKIEVIGKGPVQIPHYIYIETLSLTGAACAIELHAFVSEVTASTLASSIQQL